MSRERETKERERDRGDDRRAADIDEGGSDFKVFVGGISWHLNDDDLLKTFKKYGANHATVMQDKRTGRSRGFGFVLFRDKEGMEDAISKLHGTEVDGRKISVTRAIPQSETVPGTPSYHLARGGSGYDRGHDRGGYGRYDRGPPSYRSRGPYERPSYERPPYDYDRYGSYGGGGYERPSYGSSYARDPYPRDYAPDNRYNYDYPPPAADYRSSGYPPSTYDRSAAAYDRYQPEPARGSSAGAAPAYDMGRDDRYRGSGGADRDYGRYAPRPYEGRSREDDRAR